MNLRRYPILPLILPWVIALPASILAAPAASAAAPVEAAAAVQATAMTPELLWELRRVSGPVVSPDGTRVVFGVSAYDLAENGGGSDLFIVDVAGGEPRRLTTAEGSEFNARWRPDGGWIGFLAASDGAVQLWEIRPDGTGLRQVSQIEGGIANFDYSPAGTHVSFTREIDLTDDIVDLYPDLPEAEARIIDSLMYRHWDSWEDGAYSHLFLAEYDDGTLGDAIDLMPGERFDTPLHPFGGAEQIAWSADGSRIAYTAKKLYGTEYAVSTNSDVYVYEWSTETTTNRSAGNVGYDVEPVYSPSGGLMAWLSMERDGYEADRNRIVVAPVDAEGEAGFTLARELTVGFDADAGSLLWAPDGLSIYFAADVDATTQLFNIDLEGNVRQITRGVHNYGAFDLASGPDGPALVASRVSMSAPADLYRVDPATGAAEPLTRMNADLLEGVEMGRVERRMVTSTDGAEILTWVILPPGFDPDREYPALLYAQGGPQSTVSQFWSYRWNFQLMAANGYVVVAPNRRGVPSFGQEYKEEISGDWGGQAMQDLLAAIDDVAAEPWVDENRLGAVGASFGGFTVYWLAGNHEGRFKTFVAHAGVFNFESMYGVTEEMFFVNFDLEGPYWSEPRPASYDRFSPHLFVGNWDTPILVIHGQRDFRVPVGEGMQAFSAAQLQGIESRFLYFPDEGHWVLSPQNGVLWHRLFFDWLDRFLKP
jgi:dipeptidyl aminopeptidase/acylaminoacyl peptidase